MKTIDITPTWTSLVLTMAHLYVDGTTFESRNIAKEELLRMAKLADLYVAEKKKNEEKHED